MAFIKYNTYQGCIRLLNETKKDCVHYMLNCNQIKIHAFIVKCLILLTLTNHGFLCSNFWYMSSLVKSTSKFKAFMHINTALQCGDPGV